VPIAVAGGPAQHVLEWGHAARAIDGERESGDLHLVAAFSGGFLVAAVDGLGHGPRAAAAARAAVAALAENAEVTVIDAVHRCHEALRSTRGAALALARFSLSPCSLEWISVGNVDAALVPVAGGKIERVLLRGGVVGHKLPPLRAATLPVRPGDLLILATDGIRTNFTDGVAPGPPEAIAEGVLERFGKHTDDALVLAARLQVCG
jgi:negative regulator of sigma-B (phosphoserine phosphatase)